MPFDFNIYSALLLPAFIQGLVYGTLSFIRFKKEQALHDLFLGMLLILMVIRVSFWMLGFAGWYDSHDTFTSLMFYFPFNILALIGPCLYFYFLSLTNRDFCFKRKYRSHLLLPVIVVLLYAAKWLIDVVFYRPWPNTEAYQFGTHGPFAQIDKTDFIYIISYISLLFYSILVIFRFKAYRNYLLQHFTDSSIISLHWLQNLLWIIIGSIGLSAVVYGLNYVIPNLSYGQNWYPYFILGFAIYYISINGYQNSPALFNQLHFEPEPKAAATIPLAGLSDWATRLENLMNNEKLYLETQLNLQQLAVQLNTNPQTISKVINDGFGQNFSDYINSLRVGAVVEQLKSGAHQKFSLNGIAFDCGFNSKTTFNRAFKKVTGRTPSEYIANL